MPVRFKCTNCKKGLVVKDHLAGKRVACPVCKTPVVVPVPQAPPVDVEALAAAALAEDDNKSKQQEQAAAPKASGTIDFVCQFCDAELKLPAGLAGKKEPCPECKRIIRVPNPAEDKPKDWRSVQAGPSVALAGPKPPELEGAWGTSNKAKVSQQSLADADAIPEAEEEPVGILGWTRRLTILAIVGGLIYLAVLGINSAQQEKQQTDSLAQAQALVDEKEAGKIAPAVVGEVYRGVGEIYLRKAQAKKAQQLFGTARSKFPLISEKEADHADDDFSLLRLVLAQVELGGNEKQAINDERIQWDSVERDLSASLQRIRSDEVRVMAVREVGSRLVSQGQGPLAVTVASKLKNASPALLGQWVALVVGQGHPKLAAKEVRPPEPNSDIDDISARSGYAEGKARTGDFEGAWKIVQAGGGSEASHLQAALGVAELRLGMAQAGNEVVQAQNFVNESIELFGKAKTASPWSRYQVIRVAARAGMMDKARDILKGGGEAKLWQELKSWAELEIVQSQLGKSQARMDASIPDQVADKASPAHALAWEAWARHNSRLGYQSDVTDALERQQNPQVKALIYLGMALAND